MLNTVVKRDMIIKNKGEMSIVKFHIFYHAIVRTWEKRKSISIQFIFFDHFAFLTFIPAYQKGQHQLMPYFITIFFFI